MKKALILKQLLFLVLIIISLSACISNSSKENTSTEPKVTVFSDEHGMKLLVDGKDFMVNGMNWDYFPIGNNFTYSLWEQPEEVIKAALDYEMALLQNAGVNAIRQYTGVPAKWIEYIYNNYGIYTMLNHSFGRYGLMINNNWIDHTDYSSQDAKEVIMNEVISMTEAYKDTEGLLLFLLGNENNYGLFWEDDETEDIPDADEEALKQARHMYRLFNEAAVAMNDIDKNHPVAICNGDMLFLDIIKEECLDVDIFGVNMYRGASFGNAFSETYKELNIPILFTEFGADAFDAISNKEDQISQAFYMVENWKEIYINAYGLGKTGNSLGGFTFQFSDGWWKYGQTKNLDIHDNNASWSNGGYQYDFKPDANNMNEEWFGVCAKGPTIDGGIYELKPRAAYYAIKEAHKINPLSSDITIKDIEAHFQAIDIDAAARKATIEQQIIDE